mgnify:CR=1 FL=1
MILISKAIYMMSEGRLRISGINHAQSRINMVYAPTSSVCSRNRAWNLKVDHKDYVELLRKLEAVPGVEKSIYQIGNTIRLCDGGQQR